GAGAGAMMPRLRAAARTSTRPPAMPLTGTAVARNASIACCGVTPPAATSRPTAAATSGGAYEAPHTSIPYSHPGAVRSTQEPDVAHGYRASEASLAPTETTPSSAAG